MEPEMTTHSLQLNLHKNWVMTHNLGHKDKTRIAIGNTNKLDTKLWNENDWTNEQVCCGCPQIGIQPVHSRQLSAACNARNKEIGNC